MARRSPSGRPDEGVAHALGDGEVPDLVLDVVPGFGRPADVPFLPPAPGLLGPEQVDRAPVALGQQEGPQGAATGVELLGPVPEAEEHLLHDLLGEGVVVEETPGEPVDGPAVAPVGLGERLLVVPRDGDDEPGVGELGDGGGVGVGMGVSAALRCARDPARAG